MFEFFGDGNEGRAASAARLKRIERKLDLIMKNLGIVDPEPADRLPQACQSFIQRGDKISAIKAYREATGAGLAEAKHIVESHMR